MNTSLHLRENAVSRNYIDLQYKVSWCFINIVEAEIFVMEKFC
jgi:hypothetical protein